MKASKPKQEQPEQVKPVEPKIAEYWKQPPRVQGVLRKKVDVEGE